MPNPSRQTSRTASIPIPGAPRSIEDILNLNSLGSQPRTPTSPHRERSLHPVTRSLYSGLEGGRPSLAVRHASASTSAGVSRHALGGGSGPPWGARAVSTSSAPSGPGSFGGHSAFTGFEPRVIGGSGAAPAERGGTTSRRDSHTPTSPTRTTRVNAGGRPSAHTSHSIPIRSHHAPAPAVASNSPYGHHLLGSGAPTPFKVPSYLQYTCLRDLLQTTDASSSPMPSRTATFSASGRDATPFTESDEDSEPSTVFLRKSYAYRERGRLRERQTGYSASSAVLNADPVICLPTRWSEQDKQKYLQISEDGRNLQFHGPTSQDEKEAAAARANNPIPPACGIYYYEVTILDKGHKGHISVGFSHGSVRLSRLPGWEKDSWGYHGDDGHSFASEREGTPYGPGFTTEDVVGCGIDFSIHKAFFTKNGAFLGYAFDNIGQDDEVIFPAVGLRTLQENIRVNFGQEQFKYDIDTHVHCARERTWEKLQTTSVKWRLDEARDIFELEMDRAARDMSATSANALPIIATVKAEVKQEPQEEEFVPIELPPDYSEPINKLVMSYLQHHGFERTASAFGAQMKIKKKKAGAASRLMLHEKEEPDVDIKMETDDCMPEPTIGDYDGPFDFDGLKRESSPDTQQPRQRVVNAVLTGDIDLVLRLTQELFPSVLEMDDGFLHLKLKCRKFVELMLHTSDALQDVKNETAIKESEIALTEAGKMDVDDEGPRSPINGLSSSDVPTDDSRSAPVFSPRMERSSSRTSPSPAVVRYQTALSEALAYGKALHAENPRVDSGTRPEELALLKTTFSLVTYDDPRTAGGEVQALASQEARARLAQEVNQAILESQGRPSRPALERLYRQVSATIAQLALLGNGDAAFVDVESEFLDN
ncbi:hypothetical protein M0805_000284 [Coniferiporia weirii]|nr:hypothetical protein M0805_000284 [Coniferiporia weirii]